MAHNIVVFGLGAVGSNILVQLHKRFPDAHFTGVDYDKVEDRNIKTQAYFNEHKGKPKAAVIPTILARKDSVVKYTPVNQRMASKYDVQKVIDEAVLRNPSGMTVVIDAFDNTQARQYLKDAHHSHIVHIGFSPEYSGEIFWNENYTVPGEMASTFDICELDAAVFFIHFIVNFAGLKIANFMDGSVKENYIITDKTKIRKI